jgi:pyruvate formate lyase activating enzyme
MYTDMLSEESSGQCKTQIFTGFFEKISRSVELLRHSEIDYEFRTTVVRGLHDESDFADIAKWLSGAPKYYLQSFRDCPEVLQQGHSFSAFSKEEMLHFLSTLQKEIPQACLRES